MSMLSRLFNKSIRLFYESLFRLRLSIAERLAGRDDPRLVSFLRSQRDEYFALFQYHEALSLGRRCLKINGTITEKQVLV